MKQKPIDWFVVVVYKNQIKTHRAVMSVWGNQKKRTPQLVLNMDREFARGLADVLHAIAKE